VRRYSTFILPPWIQTLGAMRDSGGVLGEESGARLPPYVFIDYHRIDSGLNAAGPYVRSLCGIDRIENWTHLSAKAKQARKTVWMDRLIADLDREFQGIAEAVVHREMATAETMANYLNTPDGAVYGFALEREGSNPLGITARTATQSQRLDASTQAAGPPQSGTRKSQVRPLKCSNSAYARGQVPPYADAFGSAWRPRSSPC
jgi:hypothetical protein